ncbi:hypothetical protein THAOC_10350, partial [Thalassiosira oceanica]
MVPFLFRVSLKGLGLGPCSSHRYLIYWSDGDAAWACGASRATDRPTESLNPVAAVSTEDIIANRAAPPPGPSPPPGGGAVRIRDIQFPATSA